MKKSFTLLVALYFTINALSAQSDSGNYARIESDLLRNNMALEWAPALAVRFDRETGVAQQFCRPGCYWLVEFFDRRSAYSITGCIGIGLPCLPGSEPDSGTGVETR